MCARVRVCVCMCVCASVCLCLVVVMVVVVVCVCVCVCGICLCTSAAYHKRVKVTCNGNREVAQFVLNDFKKQFNESLEPRKRMPYSLHFLQDAGMLTAETVNIEGILKAITQIASASTPI